MSPNWLKPSYLLREMIPARWVSIISVRTMRGLRSDSSPNRFSKLYRQRPPSSTPVAIGDGLGMCQNFATTYPSYDRWDGLPNSGHARRCNVLSQRSKLSWD